MTRRRRRAIALMFTLMLTALVVLLMSAFFKSNLDQIRIGSRSDTLNRAHSAAWSGIEYARMRLEADEGWGVPSSSKSRNRSIAGLQIFENDRLGGGADAVFNCVGVLPQSASHFQVSFGRAGELVNDVAGGRYEDRSIAANPTAGPGAWSRQTLPRKLTSLNYLAAQRYYSPLRDQRAPGRSVSPGTCQIRVTGYCQGVVETLDVSLEMEATSRGSVKSGGSMTVEISRPDPTTGPSGNSRWVIASVVSDLNRVESGGDLNVSGVGPGRTDVHFENGQVRAAQAKGDVQLASGAAVTVDNDRLDVNYASSPTALNLPSANSNANGKFEPDSPIPPVPDLTSESVASLLTRGNTRMQLPGGDYHFTGSSQLEGPAGSFSNEIRNGSGQLVARLKNYRIEFSENAQVEFTGTTRISGESNSPAHVLLGFDGDGTLSSNSKGSSLTVKDGNLSILGSVAGKGSVMVTGNGTSTGDIEIQGKSQMSADPEQGVTMFADRNIRVNAPDPSAVEFFDFDLAAISSGINNYTAGREFLWERGEQNPPLNEFSSLTSSDQDRHTTGGGLASDATASNRQIKTALIPDDVRNNLVQSLRQQFPVTGMGDPDDSGSPRNQFANMLSHLENSSDQDGLTVGRYLRLREYAREMHTAFTADQPIPGAAESEWYDLSARNELINQKLKAEIGFFERQAQKLADANQLDRGTLKRLIRHANSNQTQGNLLEEQMDSRDVRWTGLMYARGSVWVNNGGGSLDARGSLIGRRDVAVVARSVKTTYDPQFLRALSHFVVGDKLGTRLAPCFYRVF